MKFSRNKKRYSQELSPDEIFLDSVNIPGFEQERMEGRLELPLSRRSVFAFFMAFAGIAAIFSAQLFRLQVVQGQDFAKRASSNRLEIHTILPARGLVLDRNGERLVWNDPSFQIVLNNKALSENVDRETLERLIAFLDVGKEGVKLPLGFVDLSNESENTVLADFLNWEQVEAVRKNFPEIPLRVQASAIRRYVRLPGFAHLLGYLGYPSDRNPEFLSSINIKTGKSGIELLLNKKLGGVVGERSVEADSKGREIAEAVQKNAIDGETVKLTIDIGLQAKIAESISMVVRDRGFRGGAGIALDLKSGDVLAITSFPEFDSNLLTSGISRKELEQVSTNPANPFFFRAVDGLYQPGSVIKPLVALAALSEGTISPEKEIFSSGSISVPNPYFPDKPSVFRDWKAHGWVDMREALAVSSNVYFYAVGGGYEDVDGLGVSRIEEYLRLFGFDDKIDFLMANARNSILGPDWKKTATPEDPDWRIGDTYNLSIGQSVLATPLAILRLVSAIALDGNILKFNILDEDGRKPEYEMAVDIPKSYFAIVKEGMRKAVLEGTAQGLSGLGVNVAGKTGTAEIGNGRVHSWFMGFLPYEDPKFAIVLVLESGDAKNLVGAPFASRQVVEWLAINRPEYIVDNSIDTNR